MDDRTVSTEALREYINSAIPASRGLLREMELDAERDYAPIADKATAAFLSVLCAALRPRRILEIGTAIGYSAVLMRTYAAQGAHISTIERYERAADRAQAHFEKTGFRDDLSLLRGEAVDILPTLTGPYDMIFLDGAKGQYPRFLPDLYRLLEKGGVLVCDNVLFRGMTAVPELTVRRKKTIVKRLRIFVDDLMAHDGLLSCILALGDGVTFSVKL